MSLMSIAEADLAVTLEDAANGGATMYTLYSPDGEGYPVAGVVGDIGYLIDSDGSPVEGRSIVVTCRISTLNGYAVNELKSMYPSRGWWAECPDVNGKQWKLFVIRNEPDRTLGIYRMVMSLSLQDTAENTEA